MTRSGSARRFVRGVLLGSCALWLICTPAAARPVRFDIPSQDLSQALIEFGAQSGLEVIYTPSVLGVKRSARVQGDLEPRAAMAALLEGTGLTFRENNGVMRIVETAAGPTRTGLDLPPRTQTVQGGGGVMSVAPTMARMEEIVVTAQKKAERLIDVPQSVSVLSAGQLANIGAMQFRDIVSAVPGLNFQTSGAGFSQISMRGVTVGFDVSPTVGIYVDEVPFGSTTTFTLSGQFSFDAALFDLDRVEVLRGPQGTLYGASTMGGLIKYVTPRPDTGSFKARAQAGLSATNNGGVNYNVAASVNAPIEADKAALRVSAFESHDGGFIDNRARSKKDVNRSDIYGGRFDLLLTPNDALAVRLNLNLQNIERGGEGTADYTFTGATPFGNLGQFRPTAEPFDQRFRLISGTVTYDLDWASLVSISSYQTVRTSYSADISAVYVPLVNSIGLGPYSAIGSPNDIGTNKFTQEVRLASKRSSSAFEWVVGGFYNREASTNEQSFAPFDQAGNPAPNILYEFSGPSIYREYAAFGDVTWHLTEAFDVTGGVRYARNRQAVTQYGSGIFVFPAPKTESSEGVSTYLANARYRFDEHTTAYVRYATGYRPGGPNALSVAGGPAMFQADRLKSYEAGIKAETADQRFSIDASAYYIDWSNIQLLAIRDGFGIYVNAPGGAKIGGAELALTAQPVDALTVTGVLAFQNAHMSRENVDLGAAKDERLPNVPRFTASLNADYVLSENALRPTIGGTLRYVGQRKASFEASTSFPQYRLPAYATVDLRGGVAIGGGDAQLFVYNLFDKRGQMSLLLPQYGARVALVQPRTIGVRFSYSF